MIMSVLLHARQARRGGSGIALPIRPGRITHGEETPVGAGLNVSGKYPLHRGFNPGHFQPVAINSSLYGMVAALPGKLRLFHFLLTLLAKRTLHLYYDLVKYPSPFI